MHAANAGSVNRTGRLLALQLWLCSVVCWWGLGIPFSRLWWLVNEKQLHWILFCYAWEVPAVGWTGAVIVPWYPVAAAHARSLLRHAGYAPTARPLSLPRGPDGPRHQHDRLRPRRASGPAICRGAAEAAKIVVQGPVLGGLLAVAAYFLAERAIRTLTLPHGLTGAGTRISRSPTHFTPRSFRSPSRSRSASRRPCCSTA